VFRIACFIPAARWLGRYERGFVARDLGGRLAVGWMLIPQGLAFAQIVRAPPVQGLWSGVAAMIAYAQRLIDREPAVLVVGRSNVDHGEHDRRDEAAREQGPSQSQHGVAPGRKKGSHGTAPAM